jgi:hypothetical protein
MSTDAVPRFIDRLMSPEPKIIVAPADADAARGLLRDWTSESSEWQWLIFESSAHSQPMRICPLQNIDCTSTPLSTIPGGPCVLALWSDQGRKQLAELAAWWRDQCPAMPAKIVDLSDTRSDSSSARATLYRQLYEAARDELRCSDERVGGLQGELYELRTEYEQARGVLKRIQDYCAPLSPFRLIEILQPADRAYPFSADSPNSLVQPLPTSAGGLAAIDLFSPSPSPGTLGEGDLMVFLRGREVEAPLAAWRIPYDHLGRGWIRCALPVALIAPVHHVDLKLQWRTLHGSRPQMALAGLKAFPEIPASVEDAPLDGALAFALWGALAGTSIRVPTPGWSRATGASTGGFTVEYLLEGEDILRIKPMSSAHFPYMHPLPDLPGIRLHPLDHTLATAVLKNACLADTDRVIATGQVRHVGATLPVEYAMCLTDSSTRCPYFPPNPEKDARVVGFSGWQVIESDHQPHFVILELDRPLTAPADLHFATRMRNCAPITNHWADWLEVRIRLRYSAFSGVQWPVDGRIDEEPLRRAEHPNRIEPIVVAGS